MDGSAQSFRADQVNAELEFLRRKLKAETP